MMAEGKPVKPASTAHSSETDFGARPNRALKIAWGILSIAVVTISVVQVWRFMTRDMIDFTVVYRAGERALHGQPIYDFSDGLMLYKYAPIISYLFAPLALLPKSQSAFVFFLLSVASFVVCFRLAFRWVVPEGALGWASFVIVTLTLLSTLRVIMNSLDFGQVQVFILVGMLYCSAAFASGKWMRGGLVLSLVTLSKIVPGVLCVPWLLRRQWRPALATAVFSVALLVTPALWLGPERAFGLIAQWWNLLQVSTNQSLIERWTNQSLLSALVRIFATNHYHVNWFGWEISRVIFLTKIILGLWLASIFWLGYRRDEKRFPSVRFAQALDLSYYLLFIIVAFPLAWRYHFTSMILPNMLIVTHLLYHAKRDYFLWVLFVASLFLSSVVNQEMMGSRLFEWFHIRSCLTLSVLLATMALLRVDRYYRTSN